MVKHKLIILKFEVPKKKYCKQPVPCKFRYHNKAFIVVEHDFIASPTAAFETN